MSYDVHVFTIRARKLKTTTTFQVRWTVDGRESSRSFAKRGLADSFRGKLLAAQRGGEDFSPVTGLPTSMDAPKGVTVFEVAAEFIASRWGSVSGKERIAMTEVGQVVVPALTADPLPELRAVLWKALNPKTPLTEDEARVVELAKKASRPVSDLADPAVAADLLDALARKLDGSQASPAYFGRRKRGAHLMLAYAVRKGYLAVNPLAKANIPAGWTAPAKTDDSLDPRSIGSPELVESMLETCGTLSSTVRGRVIPWGQRMKPFYACMYLALMRPSEVAALAADALDLPDEPDQWGWLNLSDAASSVLGAFTDDGRAWEDRGLKGRTNGRPSTRARKPSRRVPVPPELVAMLRAHIAANGLGPDGRLFRTDAGNPVLAVRSGRLWRSVRAASLDEWQLASPLMARPYDLRHAGVTRRLNEGVPEATVAQWAGHSIVMLRKIYHHVIEGQDEAYIARMDAARRRTP